MLLLYTNYIISKNVWGLQVTAKIMRLKVRILS